MTDDVDALLARVAAIARKLGTEDAADLHDTIALIRKARSFRNSVARVEWDKASAG